MSAILGKYKNNYKGIFLEETCDFFEKFSHVDVNTNKSVMLKIIDIKKIKLGGYDYLLKQINNEKEIMTKIMKKLPDSEYIVKLNKILEDKDRDTIIFEYENFGENLHKYLIKNCGGLGKDKNLFINIVKTLVNALFIIHQNEAMHRNINPDNIFIDNKTKKVKLGGFDYSTFIKDNDSIQVGSLFYKAPEMIKNIKYDEKCDLWSLGITLYEVYFGQLPYGINKNISLLKKTIYNEKNFILKKSNIPSLDILFKKLLVIDPKNRMTFKEFQDSIQNLYMNICQEIQNYKSQYIKKKIICLMKKQ